MTIFEFIEYKEKIYYCKSKFFLKKIIYGVADQTFWLLLEVFQK